MPGREPSFELGEGPEEWAEQYAWDEVDEIFVNRGRIDEATGYPEVWIDDEKAIIDLDFLDSFLDWIGESDYDIDIEDIFYE